MAPGKSTRRIALPAALLSAAFASGHAAAQDPGSRQTREFVQAASQSDTFEMMEAYTALAQSSNPQVKAFAQQMIQAHGATTRTLLAAVAKEGLKPPAPGVSGDQSAFLAALQSARGVDFDRAYARQQSLAHHAALAVEQGYATSGDDAAIRQVAAATVPIVTSHLQMADELKSAIGGE